MKSLGIGFENGNLPYESLKDKVPYIAGSFTGWRYKSMRPLHEWTREVDKQVIDPFEMAKKAGHIRHWAKEISDLSEKELIYY